MIEQSGTVRNTAQSKALTCAAADAAKVARNGMYTDEEYNECLVHALKGHHNQKTLCAKYGLSRPTLSHGIKRVKEHLKMEHSVDDQGCMNLLDKFSDHDLLNILVELLLSVVIHSMGGVPLLTDIEKGTVMETVGVMGGCGIGKNEHIHRVKMADSLNIMGRKMLSAIWKACERGEEVSEEEQQLA